MLIRTTIGPPPESSCGSSEGDPSNGTRGIPSRPSFRHGVGSVKTNFSVHFFRSVFSSPIRIFFFPLRSCEAVGLRREKSLFTSSVVAGLQRWPRPDDQAAKAITTHQYPVYSTH